MKSINEKKLMKVEEIVKQPNLCIRNQGLNAGHPQPSVFLFRVEKSQQFGASNGYLEELSDRLQQFPNRFNLSGSKVFKTTITQDLNTPATLFLTSSHPNNVKTSTTKVVNFLAWFPLIIIFMWIIQHLTNFFNN